MRENKFRAWDKKNEQMIRFGEGTRYSINFNGTIEEYRPALENLPFPGKTHSAYFIDKTNDFIPMQYTGLKDKNGKEIYENDVVKDNKDESVGLVIYTPPIFSVKLKDKLDSEEYWNLGAGKVYPDDWKLKDTEIIGNIYENPELLDFKTTLGK